MKPIVDGTQRSVSFLAITAFENDMSQKQFSTVFDGSQSVTLLFTIAGNAQCVTRGILSA